MIVREFWKGELIPNIIYSEKYNLENGWFNFENFIIERPILRENMKRVAIQKENLIQWDEYEWLDLWRIIDDCFVL